jgi:hypothetical protein
LKENYRQFEKTDRHLEKAEILALPGGREIPEDTPTEDLTAETVITVVPTLRGVKTAGQAGTALARAAAARYAAELGIMKNYNKANAELFKKILIDHVKNPVTQGIKGTYRGNIRVNHYFNPQTGINVMTHPNGEFLSSWRLSEKQIYNLYKTRNIQ